MVFLLKEKLVTVEVWEKQTESFGEFHDVLFEFKKKCPCNVHTL